ncbi:hypothetical protein [Sphingobium sp. WCS2017Hpa-17]|uniref:hypothetical protein n=1 Tax=Sphingobium sp. WCS2017Hpa-17 TaxID=3073638 RepID=UPI00288A42DC|nr:hypothetical protein [Sphingobium sp. WCS2017Hpa-17]
MQYPVSSALVDGLLAGLVESENRIISLEQRLRDAISRLAPEDQRKLTVFSICAHAASDVRIPGELRKLAANPGFKLEPVISQLRRAEAAYIEAHDAYLADPASGLRISEMEWALGRLTIVWRFYGEMVIALPPAKRPPIDRPMVKARTAAIPFRLSEFSEDEQHALRQAPVNRNKAVSLLDTIIRSGHASKAVRIIHARLIDPASSDMFDRWLTDQLAAMREADTAASHRVTNTEPNAHDEHVAPGSIVAEAEHDLIEAAALSLTPSDEPVESEDTPIDDATRRAIATVAEFCRKHHWAIDRVGGDRYGLKRGVSKPDIVNAFGRVRNHPAMQGALRALAERTPAEIQVDKAAR